MGSETEERQSGIAEPWHCPVSRKCGGCQYLGLSYSEQLEKKERQVRETLSGIVRTEKITGMSFPYFYRNKVHAAFRRKKNGDIISGIYAEGTHKVVQADRCLIENQNADRIIQTIRSLLPSFRITIYNEDSGYGLLRHILIRTGRRTGQVLVVLVASSPVFPSKKNFIGALLKKHPEITCVVLNVNDRKTSMVLGDRNIVLFGKGYIEDILCGKIFRISPSSFYQVNPVQTEVLYRKAMQLAGLTGNETVFDAYSGIGTIGIIAADQAREVTCVELNDHAVRDAEWNARKNKASNIRFYQDDAGRFLEKMAEQGKRTDVLFMDPPRSGSTETFMHAAVRMHPDRIVYISCNPETLARDIRYFHRLGYIAECVYPVDMFPWTGSIESVCLLTEHNQGTQNHNSQNQGPQNNNSQNQGPQNNNSQNQGPQNHGTQNRDNQYHGTKC
ncbi:MAG: 23S rRNA (uracil(1939)-C(5))-methyltransferase RlmD [Eubacterium sp.]|nr:23S rRNA (uracil(1939)-C(5))-methyltransferase RlmD [Eubacterium sp.]